MSTQDKIKSAKDSIASAILDLEQAEQGLKGSRAEDYISRSAQVLESVFSELVLAKRLAIEKPKPMTTFEYKGRKVDIILHGGSRRYWDELDYELKINGKRAGDAFHTDGWRYSSVEKATEHAKQLIDAEEASELSTLLRTNSFVPTSSSRGFRPYHHSIYPSSHCNRALVRLQNTIPGYIIGLFLWRT